MIMLFKEWVINFMLEGGCDNILQEDLEHVAEKISSFTELYNSTVLITGATGLVGSFLIRALLCANRKNTMNIRVVALIRDKERAEKIFGEVLQRKELFIVVGDIREGLNVEVPIDYIIHCASETKSKNMIKKPIETILTSIEGTKNILDLAVKKKSKSVVYISSMEVYGNVVDSNDVTEESFGKINPINLRSCYPESKRMCENLCVAYLKEYGVPTKIARLAQTFGAGILPDDNRIFAQLAQSVLHKKNIVLHTKGKSEGNYCYTRDAVIALLILLLKGKDGEAYNICNPLSHTTIANMANLVSEKIAEGRIKVVYDIPDTNIYGYALETKLKLSADKMQMLGWKAEIGLEEAYRRLIKSLEVSLARDE